MFRAYVKARQHLAGRHRFKSYREISKELGFAQHTTIRNWMRRDFPKIAGKMAAGDAGNYDAGPPRGCPEGLKMDGVRRALSQAAANFHAIQDEELRGEAIHHFDETLQRMKAKPYREYQMDDDF